MRQKLASSSSRAAGSCVHDGGTVQPASWRAGAAGPGITMMLRNASLHARSLLRLSHAPAQPHVRTCSSPRHPCRAPATSARCGRPPAAPAARSAARLASRRAARAARSTRARPLGLAAALRRGRRRGRARLHLPGLGSWTAGCSPGQGCRASGPGRLRRRRRCRLRRRRQPRRPLPRRRLHARQRGAKLFSSDAHAGVARGSMQASQHPAPRAFPSPSASISSSTSSSSSVTYSSTPSCSARSSGPASSPKCSSEPYSSSLPST